MDDAQKFQMLMRKQLSIMEGIEMLKQIKTELDTIAATADAHALFAILCRFGILTANVIVNAGQLGTAKRMLGVLGEQVARAVYQKLGASGTGLNGSPASWEGIAKVTLGSIKAAVAAELKQKGLAQFVPGASILIGFSEDSLALAVTVKAMKDGDAEIRGIARKQQIQLVRMERELIALGIVANQHLDRIQFANRTA